MRNCFFELNGGKVNVGIFKNRFESHYLDGVEVVVGEVIEMYVGMMDLIICMVGVGSVKLACF